MTTRVAIPRRVCQYKVTLSDHQAAGRRRKETETLLQITWGRGIDEECDKRFFYQGRKVQTGALKRENVIVTRDLLRYWKIFYSNRKG